MQCVWWQIDCENESKWNLSGVQLLQNRTKGIIIMYEVFNPKSGKTICKVWFGWMAKLIAIYLGMDYDG
jgi:hypothetical protein